MKGYIFILCVYLQAMTAFAQVKFTVPAPNDLQKYQMAAIQWNGSILMQISYAKSMGKPVSDIARFAGDQLKGTWNTAVGFEGFVHSILYTMVSLVPYGTVEIVEQTNDKVVFTISRFFTELKEGGTILNVTYEEYLEYWEIFFSMHAKFMGVYYSQKDTDEGLIVTVIRRK